MPLPQLNAVPKYEMVMPSTGKPHKFRPFLVKEEKVLMIAAESQEPSQIVYAIGQIVEDCVDGLVKEDLSSVDVEYAFLKIRSKSVGETASINLKCQHCETENIPYEIKLDEIKPPELASTKGTKKIDLGNNIFINLQVPRYVSMAGLDINPENPTDAVFALVTTCIESIITENEHIKAADVTQKELSDFLESMTNNQFKEIQDFVQELPKLQHEVKYNCPKCEKPNTLTLEGVQSFF